MLNFVKFQDETKKNPLVHPKVWGINPQNDNNGNKEKWGHVPWFFALQKDGCTRDLRWD
jgi:hypothetical protein